MLSALAAIQAPVLLMSQKRQAEKDRLQAQQDYEINLMAGIEIRDLHEEMDGLRLKQWRERWPLQQPQLVEHLYKEWAHPAERTLQPTPYQPPEI